MFSNPLAYNSNSHIQSIISQDLISFLDIKSCNTFFANTQRNILDLGCGTGAVSKLLLEQDLNPDNFFLLDKSQHMLNAASTTFSNLIHADYQTYTSAQHYNLIISSMAIQWMNFDSVVNKTKHNLCKGGIFCFAIPVDSTLYQINQSFELSGLQSPTITFPKSQQILTTLTDNGFTIDKRHVRIYKSYFANLYKALKSMNNIDATNPKAPKYTKSQFMTANTIYTRNFSHISWEILYCKAYL